MAAGVRCITTQNPTATYLIHLGQIINGIAGTLSLRHPTPSSHRLVPLPLAILPAPHVFVAFIVCSRPHTHCLIHTPTYSLSYPHIALPTGPVGMSIGPTLSSTWFPAHQRVTATALCAVFNYVRPYLEPSAVLPVSLSLAPLPPSTDLSCALSTHSHLYCRWGCPFPLS